MSSSALAVQSTHRQLQGKIQQLEGQAVSTAKDAVSSAKQAVGMAPTEKAPRLVLIGPPGAGKYRRVVTMHTRD